MQSTPITKTFDRQALMNQVLSARTVSELQEAQRMIESWVCDYPDDFGILDGGEQVAMLLDAARQYQAKTTTG